MYDHMIVLVLRNIIFVVVINSGGLQKKVINKTPTVLGD